MKIGERSEAHFAGLSNGRTPDSGSGSPGSNPGPAANLRSFGASVGKPILIRIDIEHERVSSHVIRLRLFTNDDRR